MCKAQNCDPVDREAVVDRRFRERLTRALDQCSDVKRFENVSGQVADLARVIFLVSVLPLVCTRTLSYLKWASPARGKNGCRSNGLEMS